jgi:FixJ family two-component response regulator
VSAEHPRVAVVDDDISVRESLQNLFRSVGLQVETFATAQEFFSADRGPAPACLVLDVRLPDLSGLEVQRQLGEANSGIPIVFITGHGDIPMSVRAMKAGAVEFLPKPFRNQDLLDAVLLVIERDRQTRSRLAENSKVAARYGTLTDREREVMGIVVQGLINKQIAGEMEIAEATVKLHRGRAMQKMEAGSLADLIRMAEKLDVPR